MNSHSGSREETPHCRMLLMKLARASLDHRYPTDVDVEVPHMRFVNGRSGVSISSRIGDLGLGIRHPPLE